MNIERRFGKFKISKVMFRSDNLPLLKLLFSEIIVFDVYTVFNVYNNFIEDYLVYTAYHDSFRVMVEGEEIPFYTLTISNRGEDFEFVFN